MNETRSGASLRHIFIAPLREGAKEADVEREVRAMRQLEGCVPGIQSLCVGRALGWTGMGDALCMTVDFADRGAFEAFMARPDHRAIADRAAQNFAVERFIVAQMNLEDRS